MASCKSRIKTPCSPGILYFSDNTTTVASEDCVTERLRSSTRINRMRSCVHDLVADLDFVCNDKVIPRKKRLGISWDFGSVRVLDDAVGRGDNEDVEHLAKDGVGDAGDENQAAQRNAIFGVFQVPDEHVAALASIVRRRHSGSGRRRTRMLRQL